MATPADASLVMQLGAEAVFVGSGIFKSDNPAARRGGATVVTGYAVRRGGSTVVTGEVRELTPAGRGRRATVLADEAAELTTSTGTSTPTTSTATVLADEAAELTAALPGNGDRRC